MKVEIGGPGDGIDVGLQREGGVEHDTQPLDQERLDGQTNCGIRTGWVWCQSK